MTEHDKELLAIYQRNLQILKNQVAQHGGPANASLSLLNQIASVEAEIAKLQGTSPELQAGGEPSTGQAVATTPQPSQPTTDDPNISYHTGNIRKLLTAAFPNPDNFETFCFDNFPEVSTTFGTGMSHTQKIQRLIEFCSAHLRFGELLELVKDENETQYNHFAGKLTR